MSTNDFIPYATAAGANVESQATYSSDPTTTAGQATGLAKSSVFNKIWRQGNFVASAIAQFILNTSNVDVLDDGNQYGFIIKFQNALAAFTWASPTFTGTASAPTVSGTTDNTTKIATTAFVQAVRALLAPITSPTFLGAPAAPTPATNDNSTNIATTAWFRNFLAAATYQSSPASFTTNSSYQYAHGLGGIPKAAFAYIINTTSDLGYAVGDIVEIPVNTGFTVWANATYIGMSTTNAAINIVPKTGGATSGITAASWNFVLIARSY